MAFKWDDESKKAAVETYEAANPTPENSMEIVKEQADKLGCTPNGLRIILTQAGVYVKKAPTTSKASSGDGSKRVSKADAVNTLNTAISSIGLDPDDEIISKLTGKAALYFAEVINSTNQTTEE